VYWVRTLDNWIWAGNFTARIVTTLFGIFAFIAVALAAAGIYSVLAYSVAQRTREIGLRMAVGGRRRDILTQFLVEAVTLSLLGGIIGVAIGIGGAAIVAFSAEWPILINAQAVMVAMAAAGMTGILFGFFPARRAAMLNPIDALRSE
jgi:putative ABC transport system permease protein